MVRRKTIKKHPAAIVLCFLIAAAFISAPLSTSQAFFWNRSVWLVPSLPSGQPVGTTVLWTAFSSSGSMSTKAYRFSIRKDDGPMRVIRDFGKSNFFLFTPIDEGTYRVKVSVKNRLSGAVSSATKTFVVTSRIHDGFALVTPTAHPLVALYSVPPCDGDRVRVLFRAPGEAKWHKTSWKRCLPGRSTNFYVAGMRGNTLYRMRHEIMDNGTRARSGEILYHMTGTPDINIPEISAVLADTSRMNLKYDVVLHAFLTGEDQLPLPTIATDLAGNVIWYYKPAQYLWNAGSMMTRPVAGGTILYAFTELLNRGFLVREIDLAGNVVRETNVDAVNDQLIAMGEDTINLFHHEVLRLKNGHTLVLTGVEKYFPPWGSEDFYGQKDVNVVGDMVIDLDKNLQVVWVWNGFDYMDDLMEAILDEDCPTITFFNGLLSQNVCGPLFNADNAKDWTHANTITYDPADGNLLLSLRHQDWVIKIRYEDGAGNGEVIWRLGADGDFVLDPDPGPCPWFSHQHQPMIYGNELVIFDNANLQLFNPTCGDVQSRGQSFILNEGEAKAELILNADLGNFSFFLGSAQKLSGKNYHFLSGGIGFGSPDFPEGFSQSIEVDSAGDVVYRLQAPGTTYRSFRMKSLYAP